MKDVERPADEAIGSSFDAFYREQYAPVVRLAYALTGRLDVAEELVQDAFLACHQHWDRVAHYDQPSSWVRRVVTNRCVSSGRRRLTELRLLARLGRERGIAPASDGDVEQFWALVRELPRRQAQVAALSFVDDLDVASIAVALGIGQESVRTHLRRARATLGARIKELDLDG